MDELIGQVLTVTRMSKGEAQRRLQELLSAARGALEEALSFAEDHDLWFEFTGLRRGPGEDLKTMDINDSKEVSEMEKEFQEWGGSWPPTDTSVLDVSEEWVGSWC